MENKLNIGIDIGGTKVNIGLVDENGKILHSTKMYMEVQKNPEELIKQISENVIKLLDQDNIEKKFILNIGIGVPGTVNHKTGFVEFCPNLGWINVEAGEIFNKYLNHNILISQDSRLAAWAEYLVGAGRQFQSFICITIGTGIGLGIIINGKIFNGGMNTAGELGHTIFVKNGRLCNCGNHGCFERYTSGNAIFERAIELFPEKFKGLPQRSESVFKLAYLGDKDILNLIHEIVEDLAIGIANTVSILSPEAIILSGGLCEHKELLIDPLNELVHKYGYYSWTHKRTLRILQAELGSDAPMIGAALLHKAV